MNDVQKRTNILDGCYHVYIDVGSNIGVQIRKLFEPHLYPRAKVRKIFQHFFGDVELRSEGVCAVGFEPNPNHTTYLKGNLFIYVIILDET